MTGLARTVLFLGAYAPAFLLLAWRAAPTNGPLAIALVTMAGFAVLLTIRLLIELRRGTPMRAEVVAGESRSDDIGGFLLGYVLPFIVADYSDTSSVAMLAGLFLLLGVITVRGHLTHLNPVLLIFGMNVWKLRVRYRDAPSRGSSDQESAINTVNVISDGLDIREGSVVWISKTDGPIWFAARGNPND